MIRIDGASGEGGGQILRSSLSLSLITGKPFRIENAAGRSTPGLLRQHLTAVGAAAELSEAYVEGAEMRSSVLEFHPGKPKPGEYHFSVGSAGSANLVLQTLVPSLLTADAPSKITVEGGTHNPASPPFEFLAKTFFPLLGEMGPRVEAKLQKVGFYPAGGGRITVSVTPVPKLTPLELEDRGAIRSRLARAVVANLPRAIGQREVGFLERELGLEPEETRVDEAKSPGPGNVVQVELVTERLTKVFTGFGEKGIPAETVAQLLADRVKGYLASTAVAGEFLADQLLLPVALAGRGTFTATVLSPHARTNVEVIQQFLGCRFRIDAVGGNFRVTLDG